MAYTRFFLKGFDKTMGHEGKYTPGDPGDPGGETYWGISRNNWPDESIWIAVDAKKGQPGFKEWVETSTVLRDMVQAFYHREFWAVMRCDEIAFLAPAVAYEIFDTGVNNNHIFAAISLQRTLNFLNRGYRENPLYENVAVDGRIGNKTLAAYKAYMHADGDVELLLISLNGLQLCRYIAQGEASTKEAKERFARGWIRRSKVDYDNT